MGIFQPCYTPDMTSPGALEQGGDPRPQTPAPRAESTAVQLRAMITDGSLSPGEHLPEARFAERFGVSRNTLRETFRILGQEGLLSQIPHRGVCVAIPTITTIIDVYRVRRLIECQAIAEAFPRHPAILRVRAAVDQAGEARDRGDWRQVGTANIAFHKALFELADSPRLMRLYQQIAAELRLAFGLIDDAEYLYAPFLEFNREILEHLEAGDGARAKAALEDYLLRAERLVLAAYERLDEVE